MRGDRSEWSRRGWERSGTVGGMRTRSASFTRTSGIEPGADAASNSMVFYLPPCALLSLLSSLLVGSGQPAYTAIRSPRLRINSTEPTNSDALRISACTLAPASTHRQLRSRVLGALRLEVEFGWGRTQLALALSGSPNSTASIVFTVSVRAIGFSEECDDGRPPPGGGVERVCIMAPTMDITPFRRPRLTSPSPTAAFDLAADKRHTTVWREMGCAGVVETPHMHEL